VFSCVQEIISLVVLKLILLLIQLQYIHTLMLEITLVISLQEIIHHVVCLISSSLLSGQ
jgi:hypothetical protein